MSYWTEIVAGCQFSVEPQPDCVLVAIFKDNELWQVERAEIGELIDCLLKRKPWESGGFTIWNQLSGPLLLLYKSDTLEAKISGKAEMFEGVLDSAIEAVKEARGLVKYYGVE